MKRLLTIALRKTIGRVMFVSVTFGAMGRKSIVMLYVKIQFYDFMIFLFSKKTTTNKQTKQEEEATISLKERL